MYEHGNAIFSRFPIKNSRSVFYNRPYVSVSNDSDPSMRHLYPKNLQHVEFKISRTSVNIFNTHGIVGPDRRDSPRRLEMAKTIIHEIGNSKNVILAGDFNVQPDTKTVQMIEGKLASVFGDELKTSYNMSRKTDPHYAMGVVDMIFVSRSIKVLEHYCPIVDISDHLPLVAILDIKP